MPPCLIGMKACVGAHHPGATLQREAGYIDARPMTYQVDKKIPRNARPDHTLGHLRTFNRREQRQPAAPKLALASQWFPSGGGILALCTSTPRGRSTGCTDRSATAPLPMSTDASRIAGHLHCVVSEGEGWPEAATRASRLLCVHRARAETSPQLCDDGQQGADS
jgi:hypothetical protein